jgi:hypothetical protein
MSEWTITDGKVLIREQEVPEDAYLFFDSPHEGLLNVANRTLRAAIDIETSHSAKVRNPIPLVVINGSAEHPLEQDEIDSLLAQWSKARRSPDGALGYLPDGLTMTTHGETDPQLLIAGRNAIRTDIGSFLNIPVALLDGTIGVDSLTYSTQEGTRNRFFEESVPYWTDPIEARLSLDDAVPRGSRVRFNKADAYAPTPNPTDAPELD